ncbi:MAG: T9SS type A sorting domain-containing protein [Psychroserpens sp.]|uniref:T9SS type A sorting domain-containing protein n=1 Tax=Psychroserpens sp. TaxID=2020870 RepID=UPI003001D9CA
MKDIKKQCIIVVLICFSLSIHAQIQIGSDIDGLLAGDRFGNRTSLSSDGNIVALLGNGPAGGGGNIRVFKNIAGFWTLYGIDINGENFGGIGGSSISISADGNTLAIGGWSNVVKVFNYDFGTGLWTQKGTDITNTTGVPSFGNSINLSSDGNTIVIGAPGFGIPPPPEVGETQIFKYDTGTWSQIGNNIIGLVVAEHSGLSVKMSLDGNIVAIGNTNSVRIYENISETWTQIGSEITGFDIHEVSLSFNGEILAIGEPEFTDSFIQRGRVRVFSYISGSWDQIGSDIIGEVAYYRTGWSVSISSDGQVLAIGEIGSTSGSTDTGRARIFENQGGSWFQIGNEIFGEASEDHSGWSVSLSSDASTLAIGASLNDGNGVDSGHARIYDLSDLLSINDFVQPKISLFPNPAREQFTINLHEGTELEYVNIYSSLGELINSINTSIINTSKLSTGIYYVEINTNKGRVTKKIVIL